MALTIIDPRKQIARKYGRSTDIFAIIAVIILTATSALLGVAPAGAASVGSVALNESAISDNVTSINISNREPDLDSYPTEPPEGPQQTQIQTGGATSSPTGTCTSNSTLNESPKILEQISEPIYTLVGFPGPEVHSIEGISVTSNLVADNSGIVVETTDVKIITDNSAILCGRISGGNKGETYIVKFRYNYEYSTGLRQTTYSDSKEVIFSKENEQIYFEIPVYHLRPGVGYACRALCGISDPYIEASNTRNFETSGVTSDAITIDSDLIKELNKLVPNYGDSEYFNSNWDIWPSQYKLMILTCIMGEGGLQGYSVQSSLYYAFHDKYGVLQDYPDTFCHVDNNNFYYGIGIGPMQIDQGQSPGWHKWSTLRKYNWKECLESTLSVMHNKLNLLDISSMEDVRSGLKTTWFAYKDSAWSNTWSAVTGTEWTDVAYSCIEEGSLGDRDAQEIIESVSGEWNNYRTVIRKIGSLEWKIDKVDGVVTYSNPDVPLEVNGRHETYQISARNQHGQHTFLYIDLADKNTEIWAYYDGDINNVKYVFAREYGVNGETTSYKIDPTSSSRTIATLPGSIKSDQSTLVYSAGKTTTNSVIQNAPIVKSFFSSPDRHNLRVGDRLQFDYEVSAANGIENIFLLRITDKEYCDDSIIDDTELWCPIISAEERTLTKGAIGDDSSPSTGTYWYGLHVVDGSGAWACEKTPIRVTVFDDSHIPEVLSPEAGAQYDSDSFCVRINLKNIDIADKYEVVLSDSENQKSKEYSSLPVTITDSEIWGSALPDGEYTVKYRYHFDENERYGYAEGYSDFSTPVSFTVGEVEDKKIFFDSAQPYTSVSIKLKERTGTAALLASGSCVEDLQESESPGVYIYRGTTPLNISITDLSQSLPSGIVSSETDSEDYVSGDKVEVKFSKYGYATEFVNITLGETENYTVALASATPESGLTDLIAKRIFTTTGIRRGEETTFYVEVINDGDTAVGPFNVGLWFHNGTTNLIGKKEVSSIPAKESLVVNGWSVVWPADNESHSVIAWADCDGVVNETDEINNLFPGIGQAKESEENPSEAIPIIRWQQFFGDSGHDIASCIQQTVDGGYVATGYTYSNINNEIGDDDIWVVKLDAAGNVAWQQYFGGGDNDIAQCIQQTADEGYIVAGTIWSNDGEFSSNNGLSDIWILKLTADGSITWQQCLGGSSMEAARSIQQTVDGGYIVVGSTRSNDGDVGGHNGGTLDIWVVKLDAAGNIAWQRCLGGSDDETAQCIRQTTDGGYIVAGSTRSNDGDVSGHNGDTDDFWVVKLTANGSITWQKCLGGSDIDVAHSIQQTADGGYIVTGYTHSNNGDVTGNHNNSEVWVVKLTAEGTIAWQQCLGGSSHDAAYDIQQTTDRGYIVAAVTKSNDGNVSGNHGDFDFWLVKLTSSGRIAWQRCLGGSSYDYLYSIQQTSDGGYIVAGETDSNDGDVDNSHDAFDAWLVKLEYSGETAPISSFVANVTTGSAPLSVQFTDTSTGSPTNWSWDFGDGGRSTEQHPIYTYKVAGIYTVNLTATNTAGADTLTRTGYINVTSTPNSNRLVAAFSCTPAIGAAPLAVQFTDASTGDLTWRAWYFGDEEFTGPWTEMTAGAEWSARYGHSSVVLPDASIVLMGGYGTDQWSDVWRSMDYGKTWTQVTADAGWSARSGHSSVVLPDGSIVLTGGLDDSERYKNDVWRSTDNGKTWMQMNASAAWSARYGHSSVALPDGSIVLMGGYTRYDRLNDIWRSTDNGRTWTQMNASAGWSGRAGHSSVALPDGSIILMGGIGGYYASDVWRSTDNGRTWTQMTASAEWSARSDHSSVVLPDGSIVLIGGIDGEYSDELWRSTNNGTTWTQIVASAPWTGRHEHTGVALPDGSIVLMGGRGSSGNRNDVLRLMTAGSSEQNPTHTYTISGTYPVSLTVANAGGNSRITKSNCITVSPAVLPPIAAFTGTPTTGPAPLTVQFTDVSTGTPTWWAWYFGDEEFTGPWTEMTAGAEWSARYGHSSVVLPDASIVLMGGYGTDQWSDVWRSMDYGKTWTQVTADAGWSARSGHSSVVLPDGSIVLTGGLDDSERYKNDVWRSTDNGKTWMQMNASAAWSARYGHSSVALPDGSIVLMGGYTRYDRLNDIWRSTDNGRTWTQMNASAGWSGRAGHSSVALPDGSIILMGGIGGYYASDVWRSTDNGRTWTQMTASAEWSARSDHSSVVLPDGSIVLIGGIDGEYSDELWRSTNNGTTWTQIVASAPWTGRHEHTGVALPDGSIVLMGGRGSSGNRNDVWRLATAGSSEQNPSHTYTELGSYRVTLRAYNTGGSDITQKTDYISVRESPGVVANFTANVTTGVAPLTVRFTDTSANSPSSWLWDFGDGNSSTEQHPTHTYALPGNHTVTLSINNGAETYTKPNYIKVTPILFGDANEDGAVNQADTLLVLQEVVGVRQQPVAGTDRFQKADIHVNGVIEVGDALFIAQYNVGLRDIWFEVL